MDSQIKLRQQFLGRKNKGKLIMPEVKMLLSDFLEINIGEIDFIDLERSDEIISTLHTKNNAKTEDKKKFFNGDELNDFLNNNLFLGRKELEQIYIYICDVSNYTGIVGIKNLRLNPNNFCNLITHYYLYLISPNFETSIFFDSTEEFIDKKTVLVYEAIKYN